jgi:hypothetical protein
LFLSFITHSYIYIYIYIYIYRERERERERETFYFSISWYQISLKNKIKHCNKFKGKAVVDDMM